MVDRLTSFADELAQEGRPKLGLRPEEGVIYGLRMECMSGRQLAEARGKPGIWGIG